MRSHTLPRVSFLALALVLLAPQASLAQYAISTVAGGGPNNLAALTASIGYPGSVAFDGVGNAYIAASYSSHIFKVDTTGTVTVVAGNGTHGYSGDGGPATSAALNGPEGVFLDGRETSSSRTPRQFGDS
jgi:trimeric autotransporter adhesin